ncbi:MAG: hypothetical protein AABY26_02810 [Nanoarchaeota archaeon]
MEKKRLEVARSRYNSKKAQVTIFIILGILLLLALLLVIFVKKEIITFKPEELSLTQKSKVETYLTNCIEQLGEEALLKVGEQGGYVEVPKDILGDASQYLRASPFHVVPYWAYGQNTQIPSLSEMKVGIDKHIRDNLRSCVKNWKSFVGEYDISEKSELSVNTEIVESKVIFNVHWDLMVKNKAGEVVSEVIDHVTESPIKLKKIQETAKLITEKEMAELKLEDITQDLLALEHPQVPLTGMEISCTKKKWKTDSVKEKFQDMLRINLRELQIGGTDVIEYPAELPSYKNHYLWNLGDEFKQPQLAVTFNYENSYPFLFEVYPQKGGMLSSNQIGGGNLLSFFCMQSWKFVYDVSYPVIVTVKDKTTGYNFKFGLTAHLKNNLPDRSDGYVPKSTLMDQTFANYDATEFCKDARVPMSALTYKLVENDYTGIYYRTPLEKVNLTFTCLYYKCPLGSTTYDFLGKGDVAGLSTNYPYCVGGILRGQKENYKDDWERVVTESGKEVELNLVPILKVPSSVIKVVKHPLLKNGKNGKAAIGPATNLKAEDFVTMTINWDKMNFSQNQSEEQQAAYGGNLILATFGAYGSSSAHEHESKMVISPQLSQSQGKQTALELESWDFLAETDYTYNLEVMIFEQEEEEGKLLGGYKQKWNVPWNKLSSAKQIVIHVLTLPDATDEEKFDLMQNLEEKSVLVPVPEIK